MYLINVQAFIKRHLAMSNGEKVDLGANVLGEFYDDRIPEYAILSHRWIGQEVNRNEMVELAKMEERHKVCQRPGYKKILASCEQAKNDNCEWLWVDTCCIDRQSSAELSEGINSMYRWYENSKVCYAYLHDVPGTLFPAEDDKRYPNFNGWPEWFSRGWTLQELIAPKHVQFFNQDWKDIGNKRVLAETLSHITGVPEHILTGGLSSKRPCVAQIMSWAANRTTTRIEDRAYSLLGLLNVNMPMLYGEGKKAFHRLQLEIIRTSDDQSIFAWGMGLFKGNGRTGSILADDPSSFWNCDEMNLMDRNEFIQDVKEYFSAEELPSIEEDHFGVFPITNRGIQIWMLLRPLNESHSVFEAWLPCRIHPESGSVRITLALSNSNYYRYFLSGGGFPTKRTLCFRQIYLRYQDIPHSDATFEIDHTAIIKNGFTYCSAYPVEMTGSTFAPTNIDLLCVEFYSHSQAHCLFAVGLGQYFGQDWIHIVCKDPAGEYSWEDYTKEVEHRKMLARGPEHARSMAELHSRGGRYGRVWVKYTCLPGSTWTVQTSCVVWESSRKCGVKLDAFKHPYSGPNKWMGLNVEGTNDPNCDMRGLMIPHSPRKPLSSSNYYLDVDGVPMEFSLAPIGIKLGDYGYLTDSKDFHREGNIFAHRLDPDVIPREHKIGQNLDGYKADSSIQVHARDTMDYGDWVTLCKPRGLSLPSNDDVNSLLASLSTRLTNRYLVIRVIQCDTVSFSESSKTLSYLASSDKSSILNPRTPLCIIAKPFVWYRYVDVVSASVGMAGRQVQSRDDVGCRA